MLRQVVLFATVGLMVSGCANETPLTPQLASVSVLGNQPMAADQHGPRPNEMPKKTMSDKVLAAIALERVTGLKPDPGRLAP